MDNVRKSVIAGSWYPGDPSVLRREIAGYFQKVPDRKLSGEVVGLIAPHAGYRYSGQVAAYAYGLVRGKKYEGVVLIGPSHRVAFPGVSVWGGGAFETPLGRVPVHEKLAGEMKRSSGVLVDFPTAHAGEHSLEIQLPFLQVALGDFSFVPLVMGDQNAATCRKLAEAIVRAGKDRRLLIVASSDLSHFHEDKEARALDGVALTHMRDSDAEGLLENLARDRTEACGGGPMAVAMLAARELGASHSLVLKYAHSGEVTGDRQSVVGYASAVYYQ
ncbi:MAG: AmmeMemoRadiSam system protein B [Smithellaceae bacterium]|jgi:AmmeMemoRadiSam system protein B|nr:AmmeMemoRadiSam system protein B [Smithellaceae bacterium]